MPNTTGIVLFSAFALASQLVLLAYFSGRRWRLALAERYGWIAYAFGLVGLAVGLWLALSSEPWQIVVGPLLFAAWAGFGFWVDIARRIDWRLPPRWPVLVPYVTLYLAAQMFLWWPMWNFWRTGWAIYLVLFVANTGLNLVGHLGPRSRQSAQGT